MVSVGFSAPICRVIRDAYDAGADYYLYATDVSQSHSLYVVSIDYGTYSTAIVDCNKSVIQSIMQSAQNSPYLNGFSVECTDTLPLHTESPLQDESDQTNISQCSFSWMTVQRMSRLANSMKKTWVCAFLRGKLDDINTPTLPLHTTVLQTGELLLLEIDHWSPVTTGTRSSRQVIKKE